MNTDVNDAVLKKIEALNKALGVEESTLVQDRVAELEKAIATVVTTKEPKEHILQFFEYAHLPMNLQDVSKNFYYMAHDICKHLPRNPERTVALRKLLEAKDAAVRAAIAKDS